MVCRFPTGDTTDYQSAVHQMSCQGYYDFWVRFGFGGSLFGFKCVFKGLKAGFLGSIWVWFGFVFLRSSIMTGKVWLRFSRKIFFKPQMATNEHGLGKIRVLESKFPGKQESRVGCKFPKSGI
jgi:hypothetical protein